MDFQGFGKISRLTRRCVVTEKIDGTNAQVAIFPEQELLAEQGRPLYGYIAQRDGLVMYAGSRTRLITPEADNFGFAKWAQSHAEDLFSLGVGRHFGEWWGSGIQRGYGLTERRFSLFNTALWSDVRPACCGVVPVLYEGDFATSEIEMCIQALSVAGSVAAPGFMKPEGVIVYHTAGNVYFKKTLDKDSEHKGQR